jgi:hypothetical protein
MSIMVQLQICGVLQTALHGYKTWHARNAVLMTHLTPCENRLLTG